MRRSRRRVLLALGALGLFACYAYRVDESQVKSIASSDMDCDPTFLKLETYSTSKDDVAVYSVHGCGRYHDYECTEDPNGRVKCKTWRPNGVSSESDDDGGTGAAVAGAAVAAGACACSKLLSGGHGGGGGGSSPASTGNSMPTDPVRNQ